MKIKIYHPEGCCPSTPHVALANAATHVAANDQWAWEAECLLAYHAGNWDHWTEVDSGDDWAEYEYDHESAKQSIPCGDWDHVATFGSTFNSFGEVSACDVEVCIAEHDGHWYIRTRDDAGGSDDCDATPYDTEEAAREAAETYAETYDECDGLSAEDWLEREQGRKIEGGKDPEGEYVLVHKDGRRWDDDRYSDRDAAETAINAWYVATQAANQGSQLLWHLMDTPELGRINDDGTIEIVSEAE